MASINSIEGIRDIQIDKPERMLGKGSMMPFNASNSGSRKLMFGTQLEHRLPLIKPEVPYIQTGYEKEFGKYSSSFVTIDKDLYVVDRISKYSRHPMHHYYMIVCDDEKKQLDVYERREYKHITESYGYIYNNDTIDRLNPGDYVNRGTVIQKSTAFDEYNNRQDGKNLLTIYNSSEESMEDAIIISESAAKALASPLIKKVIVMINENNILLNLYGDANNYKVFPDIGEDTVNGILCAVRVEKKEEFLYSLSQARLRETNISDQPYTVSGKVIDINIYPNNLDALRENEYCSQIRYYYEENIRMCNEIVAAVTPYIEKGYTMTYDLQKLYSISRDTIAGKQFFSEKVYNNIVMEIMIMEEIPVARGDKMSNRYGGKGITATIKPDHLMPKTKSGRIIDVVLNMCGVYGRENGGQLFETSVSFISIKLIEFCQMGLLDVGQCIEQYLELLRIAAPSMYAYTSRFIETLSEDGLFNFMTSMMNDESIYLVIEPMSENMTIDKIEELYEAFPWAKPERIIVPIEDSVGNIRYVESRRPVVYGYQYIYRLKQYAEEKFSVTSLSSTNIRNENTRNKSSNSFKALYSRTPIRFGEMESGNLNHLGAELVVQMLMLYSTSPHARRLTEQLMTGDPFNIDVQLDNESTNRNVEILNVYLKTAGLRLAFYKKKKELTVPMLIDPMEFLPISGDGLIDPMVRYKPGDPINIKGEIENQLKRERENGRELGLIDPMEFYPVIFYEPQE